MYAKNEKIFDKGKSTLTQKSFKKRFLIRLWWGLSQFVRKIDFEGWFHPKKIISDLIVTGPSQYIRKAAKCRLFTILLVYFLQFKPLLSQPAISPKHNFFSSSSSQPPPLQTVNDTRRIQHRNHPPRHHWRWPRSRGHRKRH